MTYRSLLIVCLATLGLAVAGWGKPTVKSRLLRGARGPGTCGL